MFCLKDLLPETHLRCWQTFVLACQYLCTPVLSKTDIIKADLLFVKFGENQLYDMKFENQLYDKKAATPNMHLHCHLKECVIDCGPVHAFWFFIFERFNGICWYDASEWKVCGDTTNAQTYSWTVCLRCKISK